MPSQFFGLNIAGSGLRNSNAALNTTANNVANVQTKGYSRQEVSSQAANALRTFTTYGCAGAGVETLSIERVRDSFYDVKYWNNNSNYGQFEVKAYYMKTIEDYFDDDGKTGFVSVFNKMSDALQAITTNASSTSTKAQFVASADAITDYFNSMYGNLQELQKDINLEIKQCVDQINSISEQVATLNKQINVIELTGSVANDLRDQRDLLVDRLSEYVDVEVIEHPVYDANDPTRETGGTRCVVKIAGGQILVDANDFESLSCEARDNYEQINQTDIPGLYKVVWGNGNEMNLNNAAMNGKLSGLVQLRDGNNSSNFNGLTVSTTTPEPGSTKYQVTIKVTDEYLKGDQAMNNCTLPESGGEIRIGNAKYFYTDWAFNGTDEYTFTIDSSLPGCASKPIAPNSLAYTQDSISYQGIPYYMTQMNSFARSFFKAVNNEFEAGVNAYGNDGTNLFSCELNMGYELTQADLENPEGFIPESSGVAAKDGYYYMTAGNVKINTDLLRDADLLGTRSSKDVGVEECGNVEKVISMLSNKNEYSFRNASANQMLELLLADVAMNASNANTYEGTFEGLKNTIDNQRTSISGVDEDEEAVNLVKYQNAYTLASKMIQTLTEIYDQLILNTGV